MRWSSAPPARWRYVGHSILAEAGSQEREHEWKEAQLRAASTKSCKHPLVASTEVDCNVIGAPLKSVKRPPASVTMATQAAISRIFTSVSITASILPAASK